MSDLDRRLADLGGGLLEKQLADLERYQSMIDGQRAVVRMEDASLLGSFLDEGERLLASIAARQARLAPVHTALTQADPAAPRATEITNLWHRLDREIDRLRSGVNSLTRILEGKQQSITTQLNELPAQHPAYGDGAPRPAAMVDTLG